MFLFRSHLQSLMWMIIFAVEKMFNAVQGIGEEMVLVKSRKLEA